MSRSPVAHPFGPHALVERADADAEAPLYRKLVGALRSEIQAGVHPVGGLLPTEAELRARFSVSRHTVREALRQLRDEGLIASRQGAGSTVLRAHGGARFVHEVASISDLIAYAEELKYQVDSSGMVVADAERAALLDCPVGQRWLRIEGFRYPEGQKTPIAWTEVYVHADFAGIALYLGRRPGPIYLWIEEMYGAQVQEVEQVFTGRIVPDELAAPLKLARKAPVIEARRNYFMAGGTLALVAITIHPADRFRHAMVLRRARLSG
jgi:DNA-binding GntR family transcriptional regulator